MSALEQLRSMVGKNENILWSGKPNFKCFILETIFNPLLPFALVWALIDGLVLFLFYKGVASPNIAFLPLLIFFTLHLMPVWIYLGGILFSFVRYKNAGFLVTDKGVYVSGGIFALAFQHKPFMEISHVNLHRGVIDRILGVGDIMITSTTYIGAGSTSINDLSSGKVSLNLSIYDIPDYTHVYNLVKELQQDIYADVQYPNNLRPKENHGYKTAYIPPQDNK